MRVSETVFVNWLAQSLAQSKCLANASSSVHFPGLGKAFLMACVFALHISVVCAGEGVLLLIWQKLISLSRETSHIEVNMALSPPLIC